MRLLLGKGAQVDARKQVMAAAVGQAVPSPPFSLFPSIPPLCPSTAAWDRLEMGVGGKWGGGILGRVPHATAASAAGVPSPRPPHG